MAAGREQFGDFETVRELNKVGAAAIYSARRVGESGPPRFALKLFQPPVFWSASETAQRSTAFLAAARLQKQVAETSKHWAPIHGEPATLLDVAYYATDLFTTSAELLSGGRRDTIRP